MLILCCICHSCVTARSVGAPKQTHDQVVCDGCAIKELAERYKSVVQSDYDLCGSCYAQLETNGRTNYACIAAVETELLQVCDVRGIATCGQLCFVACASGTVQCHALGCEPDERKFQSFLVDKPRSVAASGDGFVLVGVQGGSGMCVLYALCCSYYVCIHNM